ncbi:MAG: hypothetical protein QOH13_874 [Thermoleophilaceae bacterium]|nr:hypothetical protein [Thermoleophilaceae bacterium]
MSGTGDDANPCSRSAPCKTFAGAYSKTAAKGEINAMDDGGYGAVTISKALTINGGGHLAGVLTNAANAININAGASDRVALIGLDINGLDTATNGVKINSARSVRIENTRIFGFARDGVDFEPSSASARLSVADSQIYDNAGNGVFVGQRGKATIKRNDFGDLGSCGVVASAFADSGIYTDNCGATVGGTQVGPVSVSLSHNSIADSVGSGVEAIGDNAVARIAANDIFHNGVGLKVLLGGVILSYGNNHIGGNDVDGNPSGRVQTR